jgi:riboflavin biosynthesis pyrimidine reductase
MSEFLLVGPPWIVIDRRTLKDKQARQIDIDEGATLSTAIVEGEHAIAIFSDQDLAERHARERGPDWFPFKPKTPLDLANLLQIMEAAGFSKVIIDPGKSVNWAPIREVIAAYETVR